MATQSEITRRRAVLERIRRQRHWIVRSRKTPIRKKVVERKTYVLRFPSASSMCAELRRRGFETSKATTITDLYAIGAAARSKGSAPLHTDSQRNKRVEFCRRMLRRRGKIRLVWSDETWCYGSDVGTHTKKEWVKKGETPEPNRFLRSDPKVMVWLAFAGDGRRRIVALPTHDGTVTRDIMERNVYQPSLPFLRKANQDGFHFCEDGARTHSKGFLKDKRIMSAPLPWPPLSPDLNVCEEMNAILKRKIADFHPYGHDEIATAAKKAFAAVDASVFAGLEAKFWRKLEECVRVKGAIVKLGRSSARKEAQPENKKR